MRAFFLISALFAAAAAQAQLGHEIAQKHADREGDKLAALTTLRAEGRTFINNEVVPFTMIAQRPNKLRVESFTPLRRVIQVYDGTGTPWISHTGVKGAVPQDMGEAEAKDFISNADFDGPLVDFAEKGYSVDYAGEETVDGHKAFKLLLMNKSDGIFFLWVDAGTYEIVKRTVYKVFNGQRVAMDTYFKDFREVAGVRQPYRVETSANGRTLYVMLIDKMDGNPAVIPADTFTKPAPEAHQP